MLKLRHLVLWAALLTVPAGPATATRVGKTVAERMRNVEHGLRAEDQPDSERTWTLQERMAHYGVPGVSIAVISHGRIDWAEGYGFANADTKAPVTPATLFQAASLSKAVTAAGALRAVEEGRLTLDGDINTFLRSWHLPENEYTRATPVTLRQLLGHTAGTTVRGYFGHFATDGPLPTLRQILDGEAPRTEPVRVVTRPGTEVQYSSGGYCIVQQALIDTYGNPFPEIMQTNVLGPVGMTSSLFIERLEGPRAEAAAFAHRANGNVLESKWLGYPEMAAGGLWSTPSDLARFVIALQRALDGDATAGILPTAAAHMVSTTVSADSGLGLGLDKPGYFWASGHNPGYTSGSIGQRTVGCGAVAMTNSEHGAKLLPEVIAAIAAEYQWPEYRP